LTGRENIYLNGAILGMTKKEIKTKLEEIIEFSGCQRYIDTPVKRYSSGMTVRLAFAVAAHLDPDILVVDEVLAVGDAEFQKKAIGKMQDISNTDGRTVLFVSHNMAAVKSLCTRAIVLENGEISYKGEVEEAIQFYLKGGQEKNNISKDYKRKGNGKVKVVDFRAYGLSENFLPQIGMPVSLEFFVQKPKDIKASDIEFDIRIDDVLGQRLIWMNNNLNSSQIKNDFNKVVFKIDKLNLNKGIYYISTHIMYKNELTDWLQHTFQFEVNEGVFYDNKNNIPVSQTKILTEFSVRYDS